jgi:energy-coupling factor transporter ATP-binding protein EcfA2
MVNRVSVEASFFKKMSATENLAYAARFYGLTPRETRERIPVILDRVGFPASRRKHAMEHLSRGTQQKVALARALLTSPVLLLLDEPTTGLDPRSKLEVQDFIREVRAIHDTTILLCTHDLAEAEVLAGRHLLEERGLDGDAVDHRPHGPGLRDVVAEDPGGSAVRQEQRREQPDQGRLARAVLTQDGDALAACHLEGDPS